MSIKIRLLRLNTGQVETLDLEEYLRSVVPAEMPAMWHFEAVKTQAVASRTYALYAIKRPRHTKNGADVCDTVNCQVYNQGKIHSLSDEAIKVTEGEVILYNGQPINALFSANCGGHTSNNENVFPGSLAPYLRSVDCFPLEPKRGHGVGMCQRGARELAIQGKSYIEILKHFYTGVEIGRWKDAIQS